MNGISGGTAISNGTGALYSLNLQVLTQDPTDGYKKENETIASYGDVF